MKHGIYADAMQKLTLNECN